MPKGRLFALTRDELLESLALIHAVRQGQLDRVEMPIAPLDILAQQIVAAVACDEWGEDELFALCRQAWPFRSLPRSEFDAIVAMLSEGIAPGNRARRVLAPRPHPPPLAGPPLGPLTAITSGGAIPEKADYRVVTEGERTFVGTLNEDFAIESQAGDVFLLGNTSWRIVHVRGGEVTVRDAHGAPATVPFWLGEAPGRTAELSAEVSALRETLWQQIQITPKALNATAQGRRASGAPWVGKERSTSYSEGVTPTRDVCDPFGATETMDVQDPGCAAGEATLGCGVEPLRGSADIGLHEKIAPELQSSAEAAVAWVQENCGANEWGARQAVNYVAAQGAAIGLVPTQRQVVFERFFDESGGMQLVIHAPFGSRINKAWGLALRKCFCRTFDFELQASADDNGVVLSIGPNHSFPIERMFTLLTTADAQPLLIKRCSPCRCS